MLQLKNIVKTYVTGDLRQDALKGVSLNFRDNEFVAILGHSGSGKTTLLNIIGGLDRYTSGDLVINGVSTKKYKDSDWDAYRNHRIGFVFQSYNLIPHQTVLANVEMALTLSGVSKRERRERAIAMLRRVGLGDHLRKRPNQLSGGQMQRVAIARALINNPDILLADEPTGALDSETSVQIMDLLGEIARDKLVVMVTHNPELAEQYATRVVRLSDGRITDDTQPYEEQDAPLARKKRKKVSMSFFTALALSFNNLRTKKGRTALTAFAGSIGIIGIALILALSTGFQNYIDQIQENTLSSYPLTITAETVDASGAILAMISSRNENRAEGDQVQEQQYLTTMFSSIGRNDLKALKHYLEESREEVDRYASRVAYDYSVTPNIYTIDAADNLARLCPSNAASSLMGGSILSMMGSSTFFEMAEDEEAIRENYDILAGRLPESYDELLIVLPEPNSISDLLVYSLGLRDTDELRTLITSVLAGEESDVHNDPMTLTYGELMGVDMRLILSKDTYKYNTEYEIYEDMTGDSAYMLGLFSRALRLKVVGIASQKEESSSAVLGSGVGYRRELTEYVINTSGESEIVLRQLADREVDVFSGKPFNVVNSSKDKEKNALNFNDMISVDEEMLKSAFQFNGSFDVDTGLSPEEMAAITMSTAGAIAENLSNSGNVNTYVGALNMIELSLIADKITAYQSDPNNLVIDLPAGMPTLPGGGFGPGAGIGGLELPEGMELPEGVMPRTETGGEAPADESQPGEEPAEETPTDDEAAGDGEAEEPSPEPSETPETPPEGELPAEGLPQQPAIPQISPSLSLANVSDPKYDLTVGEVKTKLAASQQFSQMAAMLSEEDYATITAAANAMFEEFYAGLKTVDGYNNEKNSIAFTLADPQNPSALYFGTDAANTIPNRLSALAERTDTQAARLNGMVAAGLIKTITTYTVAAGIGQVLGQVMEPLSNLGDLFSNTEDLMSIDTDAFANAFSFDMEEDELSRIMTAMMSGTEEKTCRSNLIGLGYQDFDDPSTISVYFRSFDSKEQFLDFLEDYNSRMTEEDKISYSDVTGLLMSSVKTVVDAVSYVLIAFVAVSLVVSCIMIGIITHISVLERTKEIGILRALGASKGNISQVFNAETFIIGCCSGLIGVGVSLLALIPINSLISTLSGIQGLSAKLSWVSAFILVAISVVITVIGGLLPAGKAAKKDPVVALRTE